MWKRRLLMLAVLGMAAGWWGCAEVSRTARAKAPVELPPDFQGELSALKEQQEALRREIEQMTGHLEAVERSASVAGERVAANLSSLERLHGRISELSEEVKTLRSRLEEPSATAAKPAEEPTLREQYTTAFSDFMAGDYLKAVERFRSFVEKYPQSRLADNAQYWIAESYLALKDYNRALDEYRKVERNYPNGNRVPEALLRSGQALYALEDIPGYVRELRRVIELFPRDRAAEIAARSIAELSAR